MERFVYPAAFAATRPHDPAVIMAATGEFITWSDLEARSNRVAHLLRDAGLERGDHMAMFMDNDPRFIEIAWAGLRAGIYVTAINWHLTADEAAYIVNDCEAKALFTTDAVADVAEAMVALTPAIRRRVTTGRALAGHERIDDAVAGLPETPIADEAAGETMLYTSGSTGRPKGVLAHLPEHTWWQLDEGDPVLDRMRAFPNPYGFDESTVYLSPAPLYHAAPMAFCRRV
ncbi:MAG: AMP-binding protein, partial [Actinomycetota bacterium]